MLNILHVYYLEVNFILCGLTRGNLLLFTTALIYYLFCSLQNLYHRGIIAWSWLDINNLTLFDTHELSIHKRADNTLAELVSRHCRNLCSYYASNKRIKA